MPPTPSASSDNSTPDRASLEPTHTLEPIAVPNPRGEIKPLTSFRFLIGFTLFVHHGVNFHWSALHGPTSRPFGFVDFLHQGYGAVAFFFLLSGFTLAYNYSHRFARPDGRQVLKFYVNRVASIWPVHLLAFALAAGFVIDDLISQPAHTLTTALPSLVLLQAWMPLAGPDTVSLGFNGPSWSLSALMSFYLVFPLLCFAVLRVWHPTRRGLLLAPALGIAATAALAWTWQGDSYSSWFFHTFPALRLIDFFTGICACLIFLHPATSRAADRRSRTWWTGAEVAAILGVFIMVAGKDLAPLAVRYSSWYLPAIGALVFTFAHARGAISSMLSKRAPVYLGRISFPFLMLHVAIMNYLFSAGLYGVNPWLGNAVALGLSLSVSAAVFRWYETPLRRIIRARAGAWVDRRMAGPDGYAVSDPGEAPAADEGDEDKVATERVA
ncbi:MAG: acyltransferase [Thermoleophilia bacterium]|nr:acyltransferase [Thermoleophilia bacterium]